MEPTAMQWRNLLYHTVAKDHPHSPETCVVCAEIQRHLNFLLK